MVDYFVIIASKYDGWALIGALAAIRTNMVIEKPNKITLHLSCTVLVFKQGS